MTVLGDGAVDNAFGAMILQLQFGEQAAEGILVSLAEVLRIANAPNSEAQQTQKRCTTSKCDRLPFTRPDLHHVILQINSRVRIAGEGEKGQNLDAVRLDEQILAK